MTRTPKPTTMTATEFHRRVSSLARNQREMARRLGISQQTVSHYINGHSPIPQHVTDKLNEALRAKAAEMNLLAATLPASPGAPLPEKVVSTLLAHSNQQRIAQERVFAPLKRRLPGSWKPSERPDSPYPTYRLQHRYLHSYLSALANWNATLKDWQRAASTQAEHEELSLELADVQLLAQEARNMVKAGAPYNVNITRAQWYVVSRALRSLVEKNASGNPHPTSPRGQGAFNLYNHWRRYKHSGYPLPLPLAVQQKKA